MNITCCKDCIPPKRYPGCGANCEEYKKQKAELEEEKKKLRESLKSVPKINNYQFERVSFVELRRKKK